MQDTDEKLIRDKQRAAHKDFFDRAMKAVDDGYYMEAILLEYAAIESRLEVLLGLFGMPCNKDLETEKRIKVNIGSRRKCLWYIYKTCDESVGNTKLPDRFFHDKGPLKKWLFSRNTYVHGLYKNADVYIKRKEEAEELARDGLKYSRLLYNETKRLKRFLKSNPDWENKNRYCCKCSCPARADEDRSVN